MSNRRDLPEHDACALAAVIARDGEASPAPLHRAVEALGRMAHRAGGIGGEGDGCGVLVDIPRRLWADRLGSILPASPEFAVAHLAGGDPERALAETGLEILALMEQDVDRSAIGPSGRDGTPDLWQVALSVPVGRSLFPVWMALEAAGVHVASLSRSSAVYKVLGDPETLTGFASDLEHPLFATRAAVAHSRYSTNTLPAFERVQPFGRLAHNGEINTIRRLRLELPLLGADPIRGGSDTQDLDLLVGLLLERGIPLAEVLAMLLPPVQPETELERYHRAVCGPLAQGPVALIARTGTTLVGAVDRLGLRPLWRLTTPEELWLSSEPGVLRISEMDSDPAPLAAGERVLVDLCRPAGFLYPSLSSPLAGAAHESRLRRSDVPLYVAAEVDPAAHGFTRDDLAIVEAMADTGEEPIGSLGFDGPLAALDERPTVSDHFKEEVAVVTNPAIDRDREHEHFSLAVLAGARPHPGQPADAWLLRSPLLGSAEGLPWHRVGITDDAADIVEGCVRGGTQLVLLDDRLASDVDPHLSLARVMRRLRESGLARQVSVGLASGGLRNLHDIALALGTGAVAVEPWALWALAGPERAVRLRAALEKGLEKVLSTMGTHELAGYGPAFCSIGLHPDAAREFPCPALLPGRRQPAAPKPAERAAQVFRMAPKLWKAAGAVANGAGAYQELSAQAVALEAEHPVALRHLLDTRAGAPTAAAGDIDLSVGDHALPFVISAMSFGSQGEAAFRAYLGAAARLDIVAMNGEGGELPDLLGWSPRNRAQQVASGRFGVNARMLASCRMIEIKIGQGAKPGEGGHLPGTKVTPKVAAARSAAAGVDLISPANNHDLYSIEDLAQIVEELRASNPGVRVGVKVPVVSGIGTIAVGIAKAGADVITLSGYDGGTGAARRHALRHAGLPSDLGVTLAHRALCDAGLRGSVELWADGGVRTASDVVKLILLGANRVGFGTMSMVALGCTICRGCQSDTCHVGIATQIEHAEEATARGIKRFLPVEPNDAVTRLSRFFTETADELRRLVASLGARRAQDLVGRTDLLVQSRGHDLIDLSPMLAPAHSAPGRLPGVRRPDLTHDLVGRLRASRGRVVRMPLVASGSDRALLTACSQLVLEPAFDDRVAELDVSAGSVAGAGLAAFAPAGLSVRVRGGAQDGAAKGACGAKVVVLKAPDIHGELRGGSVGKGFAYGAQLGTFIVQGEADARAGIRLSGADLVIGAEPQWPVSSQPSAGAAQIKGFAFEYMTAGRAVVLGDPGPWAFAGMTGGVVYVRHEPEEGLDETAITNRFAECAKVALEPLDDRREADVSALLGAYEDELRLSGQLDQARHVALLRRDARWCFRAVVPVGLQADQGVSTE
jgi:glutamate synthase (NADPH) large chain